MTGAPDHTIDDDGAPDPLTPYQAALAVDALRAVIVDHKSVDQFAAERALHPGSVLVLLSMLAATIDQITESHGLSEML